MKILNRPIGEGYPPYLIAELSANHNGSIESAYRLIEAAYLSGADAVKIQTYTPDTITLNESTDAFMIKDGLWAGKSLYELYEEARTPLEWHKPLFNFARKIGITIFSSPFDKTAIDMLEDLNVPAYKIASFEIVDLELIRYASSTKKPLIISTGLANKNEISEAINAAREGGCVELALLHCVSGYPAPAEDYNLKTILDMRQSFCLPVGLSDHTLNHVSAITSVAFGSCIIEKHLTLNRNAGGPDDAFSMEPHEFKEMCKQTKEAWKSIGKINYEIKASEKKNLKFRRSLYFVNSIKKGNQITKEDVRSVRPANGLPPKFINKVIGKTASKDISKNTPVTLDVIKDE